MWKIFNKFIRIIAWAFLIGGIYGVVSNTVEMYKHLNGGSLWITDTTIGVMGIAAFAICGLLGFLLLKAKPYYPSSDHE